MVDLSLDLEKTSPTYLDLRVSNGDLVLTTDAYPEGQAPMGSANPVEQSILQNLRFGLGEWFLDNTKGFPWIQQFFVKAPNLGNLDALIQNTILSTSGVVSLTDYTPASLDSAGRAVTLGFKCTTTSGTVVYNGTLAISTGG